MKKYVILIIVFLLANNIAVKPVFSYEDNGSVWIEAENYTTKEGGYTEFTSELGSNGKMMILESTDDTVKHKLGYDFVVGNSDAYDIWVISTHGTAVYVTQFMWNVDNSMNKNCKDPTVNVEETSDVRRVPMFWVKLGTMDLEAGKHQLNFISPQKRQMGNDFYYHAMDSIAIVPKGWEFDPNGFSKPFNSNDLKVEYVKGAISNGSLEKSSVIKVTATNKLLEHTDATPRLYAKIMYNGEVVDMKIKEPKVPMKNWRIGFDYTEEFILNIPFNVPKGNYKIVTGIMSGHYYNGDKYAEITDFVIGEQRPKLSKLSVNVTQLIIPISQTKGETLRGEVATSINRQVNFDTSSYLSFWKDGVLWGVVELCEVKTSQFTANSKQNISFDYTFSHDMPAGNYQVKFGLHQFETSQLNPISVNVVGESLDKIHTYKPLGNGVYVDNDSGTSHFWYTNQAHTMIWDGKPYIPVGGMICPSYIVQYDPKDPTKNEANYKKDVEALKQMLSKGINDVYINSVRTALDIPSWAWQYFTDYLDENNIVYGFQLNSTFYGLTTGHMDHLRTNAIFMRGNEEGSIFKVDDVTESGTVKYTVTDYSSKLMSFGIEKIETAFIVIDKETMESVQVGYGTGKIEEGGVISLFADVKLPKEGKYFVVFSPKLAIAGGLSTNMWDDPDFLSDSLKDFTLKWNPGKNFRFFVDPTTNESGYVNWFESMRYVSPKYADMYEIWLKEKYSTITELNNAWRIEPEVKTYKDAANIVSLYTAKKGTKEENSSYSINSETLEQYKVDVQNGVMWDDYLLFKDEVFLDYNNRIADALKENINVPVIYKQTGYLNNYFISKKTSGGFDGMGNESYGFYANLKAATSVTYSEVEQARKTMWAIVTETNTDENMTAKLQSNKWGYESEDYYIKHFSSLYDAGAKGSFDFLLYGTHDKVLDAYTYPGKPEMYDWMKRFKDALLSEDKLDKLVNSHLTPSPYYMYPASVTWWWYPNKRSAVTYGDDYLGYRSVNLNGNRLVLHTNDPNVDTETLLVSLENSPATKVWGPKLLEMMRAGYKKNIVFCGLRRDLGELPEIDKYFSDEIVTIKTSETVQILKPTSTSEVLFKTSDGKPWALKDGNLYIVANKEAFTKVDMESHGQFTIFDIINKLNIPTNDSITNTVCDEYSHPKVSSDQISDIVGHWAESDIRDLISKNIVSGVTPNEFLPDNNISRAEFLMLIMRAMNIELVSYNNSFVDVSKNDWYGNVVQTALNVGIIDRNMILDGYLNPNSPIMREEIASIVVKAYCLSNSVSLDGRNSATMNDEDSISKWALSYVKASIEKGFMKGINDAAFAPKNNSTRAEAVVVIKRFMELV